MELFKNNFFRITKVSDDYFIESFQKGFPIQEFNSILTNNPEIRLTSFTVIRDALLNAPRAPAKFGESKERILIEITNNDMNAYVTLCVEESDYTGSNKYALIKEVVSKLQENGIMFGIKSEALLDKLRIRVPFLIAEGIPPVNGEDSIIRIVELKEPKPEIKDDGKANYYELNLINKVNAGDWLGERTDPTEGTSGKTVKGAIIKPLPGKRFPLFYDPATVKEVYKDGITTLYSKVTGAVHFNGDKINVSNYLEIAQDVGFNTGNIDFDGFLTVKGAITDNFSVAAKNDIEILGEFGVGSVKEVISRNGNILIKGGIAGRNKAVIRATKDIYTKFISDATVICDGVLHVGYYCLNSNIIAKQLIIESNKGQIIGGNIKVQQKVVSAFIGNQGEKRTHITVTGFDRKMLKEELEQLQLSIQSARSRLAKAKQLFSIFQNTIDNGSKQYMEYEAAKESYFAAKDEVRLLESNIKTLLTYFKVKGEGEIEILKRIYPNTLLEMGSHIKEIWKEILTTCFFLQDGNMREI